MSAHTPAPWHIELEDEGGLVVIYATEVPVANLCSSHEPDAHLISAAPDMLEALKKAANQFAFYAEQHSAKGTPDADAKAKTNFDLAAQMLAVMAKAEGRS